MLRDEHASGVAGRVAEFLDFATQLLASREADISAAGLERSFSEKRLFGDDDDHDFRPPHSHY